MTTPRAPTHNTPVPTERVGRGDATLAAHTNNEITSSRFSTHSPFNAAAVVDSADTAAVTGAIGLVLLQVNSIKTDAQALTLTMTMKTVPLASFAAAVTATAQAHITHIPTIYQHPPSPLAITHRLQPGLRTSRKRRRDKVDRFGVRRRKRAALACTNRSTVTTFTHSLTITLARPESVVGRDVNALDDVALLQS
jgi:hypothetical protein